MRTAIACDDSDGYDGKTQAGRILSSVEEGRAGLVLGLFRVKLCSLHLSCIEERSAGRYGSWVLSASTDGLELKCPAYASTEGLNTIL